MLPRTLVMSNDKMKIDILELSIIIAFSGRVKRGFMAGLPNSF